MNIDLLLVECKITNKVLKFKRKVHFFFLFLQNLLTL